MTNEEFEIYIRRESDFRSSINYAVSGFLFKEGELTEVPRILMEISDDYRKEINLEK